MNILVDTSVWVEHFRNQNAVLNRLLTQDLVLCHPAVVGEICCGTPPSRKETIELLNLLQSTHVASHREVLLFLENERLYGLGCGLIDMMLLASTLLTPSTKIWTFDKRLHTLAARYQVAYVSQATH